MTTTPPVTVKLSVPLPGTDKKKRVLLVGTSCRKQDLRAETMRKLGMEVDCAADIGEARSWWRADLYDLVLIDTSRGLDPSENFCHDIRGAAPPQQLAFLVGAPAYLAAGPSADPGLLIENEDGENPVEEVSTTLPTESGEQPQRWGILEASRRISAVRSASVARTRAMQDRPAPRRDYESRESRRSVASASSLDDLLREEIR
jgi:hypothetical protein